MILIDALNLNSEGGNGLLRYLCSALEVQRLKFKVLSPSSTTHINRRFTFSFYRKKIVKAAVLKYQPTHLLCFGNFPINFKVPANISVIVNFQNAFLLNSCDTTHFSILEKLNFWLKRKYLAFYHNNADSYVFPTDYIKAEFIKTYHTPERKCQVIPYFDKSTILRIANQRIAKEKDTFVYISSTSKHKNHLMLLDAWEILGKQKRFPLLTLSIPNTPEGEKIQARIQELRKNGGRIVNVNENGYISYEKILEITAQHEFTIFPSLNETFGFGTIEGAILGNKLLISDRPFVKEVTVPSLKFDPLNAQSIAGKVTYAMNHILPDTQLVFEDKIDELLELLVASNTPPVNEHNV